MKRRLIVLDFDKTLLPYDSFRKFVFYTGKKNSAVLVLAFLRKLRLISGRTFKKEVSRKVLAMENSETMQLEFSKELVKDLDQGILNKVRTLISSGEAEILLLSASPNTYITTVAESLGFIGQGSYFDGDGKFVHMHGSEKINFIKQKFPLDQFHYFYAISDHPSDFSMLDLFEQKEIVTR